MFAATRKYAWQDDDYVTRITAMQRGYFSGAAVAGLVDGRMLDWGRLLKDEDQRKLDMKLLVAEALCHRDRDRIACKL